MAPRKPFELSRLSSLSRQARILEKMTPLAEQLGAFVAGFQLADDARHDHLVETAQMHILDALGVALAATTVKDATPRALLALARASGESQESTLVGLGAHAAAPVAALVNGSLIHGCEFDAVHAERIIHPNGPSVAAPLAIAERNRLRGSALAEAWVVAAETTLRLAAGLNDEESLFSDGFHTTAIFGTFGAAAGVSKLLGLDATQTAAALALCVSFSAGTSAGWDASAGRNKPLQPGWGAHGGTIAALLAAAGQGCALEAIDGPRGFYAAHAWRQGWSRERVLEGLGTEWKSSATSFKVYPAGGMIQAANDCVLRARDGARREARRGASGRGNGAEPVRSSARSGARVELSPSLRLRDVRLLAVQCCPRNPEPRRRVCPPLRRCCHRSRAARTGRTGVVSGR